MTNNNCLHGHCSELSLCDLGTWDWALWSRSTPHHEHLALTLAVSTLRAASALITMRGISGVNNADHINNWQLLKCYSEKLQTGYNFIRLKFELLDSNVRITTFIDAKVDGVLEAREVALWPMLWPSVRWPSALPWQQGCDAATWPGLYRYCTLPRPAVIATAQLTVVSRSQCHHPITRRKVPP